MYLENVTVRCHMVPRAVDPRTVRRRLLRLLEYLSLPGAELSCVLCNDEFIRDLNRTYRGKDKPTDVLSFAMNEGETLQGNEQLLGDIVISVETAIRQGRQLGHSPLHEVTSLAIHGLLHLLGYDHIKASDEKKMMAKSRELEDLFQRGR